MRRLRQVDMAPARTAPRLYGAEVYRVRERKDEMINDKSELMADVWVCHRCKYVISNLEMQLLRFDVGCPRCFTSLANFTLRPTAEDSVNRDRGDESVPVGKRVL